MDTRAILLFGPAGCGKTSLGKAIQELSVEQWLFYEVDKCQPLVPSRPDFATTENDRALRHANLRAARAYVDAGFRVIVEMGVDDNSYSKAEVFDGVSVASVLLRCERDTVERRTGERGNLWRDWALEYFDNRDWSAVVADLVLATDDGLPPDLARDLLQRLDDTSG